MNNKYYLTLNNKLNRKIISPASALDLLYESENNYQLFVKTSPLELKAIVKQSVLYKKNM